jgi:large repetitive protein
MGAIALAVIAGAPVAAAMAEPPQLAIWSPHQASVTNDPTPSFAGTTNDELDEVALAIHSGSSVEGGLVETLYAIPLAGEWLAGPAAGLPDGTYTAQAIQFDTSSEETGESTPVTFTVDTVRPEVSLDSVPSPSKDATPTLSGRAGTAEGDEASVSVKIYEGAAAGGKAVASAAVVPSGATWSYPAPHLNDGVYTAQATQRDEAGNVGVSEAVTFRVDTKAPAVSLSPVPSPSKDTTPTLAGGAGTAEGDEASISVTVYEGPVVGGNVVAGESVVPFGGSWSYTTPALNDGVYTAQATQRDEAGNVGVSQSVTFRVDTTPPAVSLTTPANGSFLNTSKPTFGGAAGQATGDLATVILDIYAGSTASGSPEHEVTVKAGGGSWTTGSGGPELPEGVYTVQASQKDEAGNTGSSQPATFTVKTKVPVVTLLNAPPKYTAGTTPSFGGEASTEAGANQNVTLKIYAGTSASGTLAEPAINASATTGTWSVNTTQTLSQGTYTAQAEQADEAGNVGKSQSVTFTVDTTPPAVSVSSPTNGAFLNTSMPTLSGNAGHAAGDLTSITVDIYAGSSVSESPEQVLTVQASGGSWTTGSKPPTLADGTYTVQASQKDEAGNTGLSQPVTFTVKTKAPVLSLNTPPKYTSDTTPSFSGEASTEPAHPKVFLKIYRGTSTIGTLAEPPIEATVGKSGQWVATAKLPLSQGTYTAQAEQTDEANNTGYSHASTFTVDTTPPQVTLASPAEGSSAHSESQRVSGLAGTALGDLPGISIELYAGSTASGEPLQELKVTAVGATWAATFGGLSPGTYTAQAHQSDEAGNVGESQPVTFTLEEAPQSPGSPSPSTGPATPSPPAASFVWSPANPRAGETVSLVSTSTDLGSSITGYAWSLASGSPLVAGGSTLATSFATAGNHVVQLRVADAAGLSSVTSETIAVIPRLASLLQPFPIVRFAGNDTARGVKLKLLTVQAPPGATVKVTCKGHGCPRRSARLLAKATRGGAATLAFGSFERALPAGVTLEVRVFKSGYIGKYTRFVVRRASLPVRTDLCLQLNGVAPMKCPSS